MVQLARRVVAEALGHLAVGVHLHQVGRDLFDGLADLFLAGTPAGAAQTVKGRFRALAALEALDEPQTVHRHIEPVLPGVFHQQEVIALPSLHQMVQTGKAADAVIPVDEQIPGLEVIEAVQSLERTRGGAGLLFRTRIEDVLAQHEHIVPDQLRTRTPGGDQGEQSALIRRITQGRRDAFLLGQFEELGPAALRGEAQHHLTAPVLPFLQTGRQMLPRTVGRAGDGEKIRKGMERTFLHVVPHGVHAHDQGLQIKTAGLFPGQILQTAAQTQGGWLRQGRIVFFQLVAQLHGRSVQGRIAVRLSGQEPERLLGQPVRDGAGLFVHHARQQAQTAGIQGLLEGVAVVLADARPGEQGIHALAGCGQALRIQHERQGRQQGQLVQALQGALALGIEQAQLFQRIAKKLHAHRTRIAGREDVEDVAAPGHLPRPGHQGDTLVPPHHGLIEDQLRRIVAAPRQVERVLGKEIAGHMAQQQRFRTQDEAAGPALGKAVQGRQPSCPRIPVTAQQKTGRERGKRQFPSRDIRGHVRQGKRGREKGQQCARRRVFLTVAHQDDAAASLGQRGAGKTATGRHAAALPVSGLGRP